MAFHSSFSTTYTRSFVVEVGRSQPTGDVPHPLDRGAGFEQLPVVPGDVSVGVVLRDPSEPTEFLLHGIGARPNRTLVECTPVRFRLDLPAENGSVGEPHAFHLHFVTEQDP
jgi:hypothetical protein